jgi:hypothetical protein
VGSAALAVAALLAACGGSSSDSNEPAGTYQVKVTRASFPARQFVGQTSLMKIDVENDGDKTVPALTVTVSIEGKEGETAQIPFSVHEPDPELANGDRPVWVLSATYPRLAGSTEPAGAETSSPNTYSFGSLKPGKSVEAIWKLSAARPGKYTVAYQVGAGLTAETKAKTSSGVTPGGSFVADITTELPETEVNGAGEIVEIQSGKPKSGN